MLYNLRVSTPNAISAGKKKPVESHLSKPYAFLTFAGPPIYIQMTVDGGKGSKDPIMLAVEADK